MLTPGILGGRDTGTAALLFFLADGGRFPKKKKETADGGVSYDTPLQKL